MVIIVQGLYPTISSLDGESARETLCREQLVPICANGERKQKTSGISARDRRGLRLKGSNGIERTSFAVGQSLLEEEWAVAEQFAAVRALEAFRVEVLSNRVQAVLQQRKKNRGCWERVVRDRSRSSSSDTYAFDLVVAFVAVGRDETFETVLAIELSFLLDESDVLKGSAALRVHADEVLGAPNLPQRGDEWPPADTQPGLLFTLGFDGTARAREKAEPSIRKRQLEDTLSVTTAEL